MKRAILIFVLALIAALAGIAYWALAPETPQSVEQRISFLRPNMEVFEPNGDGPHPFVILVHGCGGLVGTHGKKDVLKNYAQVAQSAGYRAIVIDSFTPRSIDFETAISQVCSGMKLRGPTRAGDVVAAYAYAQSLPDTAKDGHVIAGWSHGGWTVMDLMTMDLRDRGPTSLTGFADVDISGLTGVYLTYPYCGFPATSHKRSWAHEPRTSVVLAENDIVVQTGKCAEALKRMNRDGVPLEVEVIEGVTHAFDESDQTEGSAFRFDETNAEKAAARFGSYLNDLKNGAEFPNSDRFFVDVAGAEQFE